MTSGATSASSSAVPASVLDAQLEAAACALLKRESTVQMLLDWLRTTSAHLELSGLRCSEPVLTDDAKELSAGRFSGAQMEVTEPSSAATFKVQAVLHAYTTAINFGGLHAAMEAYFITVHPDGRAENYLSLARAVLLSAERFDSQTVREMPSDEHLERLAEQLREAQKTAFAGGIGPHLHRFRLELEESLSP